MTVWFGGQRHEFGHSLPLSSRWVLLFQNWSELIEVVGSGYPQCCQPVNRKIRIDTHLAFPHSDWSDGSHSDWSDGSVAPTHPSPNPLELTGQVIRLWLAEQVIWLWLTEQVIRLWLWLDKDWYLLGLPSLWLIWWLSLWLIWWVSCANLSQSQPPWNFQLCTPPPPSPPSLVTRSQKPPVPEVTLACHNMENRATISRSAELLGMMPAEPAEDGMMPAGLMPAEG